MELLTAHPVKVGVIRIYEASHDILVVVVLVGAGVVFLLALLKGRSRDFTPQDRLRPTTILTQKTVYAPPWYIGGAFCHRVTIRPTVKHTHRMISILVKHRHRMTPSVVE